VIGTLVVGRRSPLPVDEDWMEFLDALAGQAAMAIESVRALEQVQRSRLELSVAQEATIEGWARALDLRDRETGDHTLRVAELSVDMGRLSGMSPDELVHLRHGALLHDIGKMGVPDSILHKAGPLSDDEWAVMKRHPVYAYELLNPIIHLRPALEIPYCHHERWDGSGYPRGLAGEAIPVAARLFSVVDVWDALRSNRPYRAAWPNERVLDYITDNAGKQFAPRSVELFKAALKRQQALAA
jgi:HD-GYP domain-containing protein (c-di-GMP phosphodiesterase class II)